MTTFERNKRNKEKIIKAIEKLIEGYNAGEKLIPCPLCIASTNGCKNCPNYYEYYYEYENNTKHYCSDSYTFIMIREHKLSVNGKIEKNTNLFKARADYWKERLSKLKRLESIHFSIKKDHNKIMEIMKDD